MTESQQSEGLLYFTLFNLHVNTYNEIINKQSFLSHIHHSDMSKVLKFLNSTDTDDTYRPPNSDLVLGDFPPYRTDCSCNMKTFIRTIAKNGWLDVQLPPKDLDMNEITDLSNLFNMSDISGIDFSNISMNLLDVSGVTDMSYMFKGTNFNEDISDWNVSKVTDFSEMFANTPMADNSGIDSSGTPTAYFKSQQQQQ